MSTPITTCVESKLSGYYIKMFVNNVEVREWRLEHQHDAAIKDVATLFGQIDIELAIGSLVYFTLEVIGGDAAGTYVIEPNDLEVNVALERLF
jgi:hypothetical protein